jgi:hypothetical protein
MKLGGMIRAYQEGRDLTPRQRGLVDELNKRKNLGLRWGQTFREKYMEELAQEQNWLQSLGISVGRGLENVVRGVGLLGEREPIEEEAYAALKKEHPITTGAGEIIGEAAPFAPFGMAAGGLAAFPARVAAGTAVAGLEGAVLSEGDIGERAKGGGVGAGVGFGAELLFPVLGRLGSKVFQRLGRAPKGALLDAAGQPTPELLQGLDDAGMTFDDLTDDAVEFLRRQKPGADPGQAARAARFTEEGIPATKGELTQEFAQQAREQHLVGSITQEAAEPLRAFKKAQSDRIQQVLTGLGGEGFDKETTGGLVQAALEGRQKLLRTTKNALYNEFADLSEKAGLENFPLIIDPVIDVLPDARKMKNLNRVSKGAVKDGMEILAEYGIVPAREVAAVAPQVPSLPRVPKEAAETAMGYFPESGLRAIQEAPGIGVEEAADLVPEVLTIDNYDDVLQSLKMIMRGDQTGASAVAFRPIIETIENEVDNFADTLAARGDIPEDVLAPLRKARETVRTLKTEFAPRDIASKMISQVKSGGEAMVTEASQVYDKLMGAGVRVEDTRRLVRSLRRSEDGKAAIGALQSTAVLDLMDAAFTTNSRKIAGESVFNPVAFINHIKKLNKNGKLDAIFANQKDVLKRLKNITQIAKDLVPPERAVPKGSASGAVFMGLAEKLALNKIPGFNVITGIVRASGEPVKAGAEVREAVKGAIDVRDVRSFVEVTFPRLASALGIAAITGEQE